MRAVHWRSRVTRRAAILALAGILMAAPALPPAAPREAQAGAVPARDVARFTLQGTRDVAAATARALAGAAGRAAARTPASLPRLHGTPVSRELLRLLRSKGPDELIEVIVTYDHYPTAADLARLRAAGIRGGVRLRVLPVIGVVAPVRAVERIARLPGVVSLWHNGRLRYFMKDSRKLIGVDRVEQDPRFQSLWAATDPVTGRRLPMTGVGVKVAVIDSGIDATHPDLPYGTKVIENRKLVGLRGLLSDPSLPTYGLPTIVDFTLGAQSPNTDTSSGHGTHVAGTVAGLGLAWQGGPDRPAGVATGAQLVGFGTGDTLLIFFALEAFDAVLQYNHANPLRPIRITTNSWGLGGSTDPEYYLGFLYDPIVMSTLTLYRLGVVTVFAAGNDGGYGTLNPYSIWPWVISVAAGTKDGQLAGFSSRGLDPLVEPYPGDAACKNPADPERRSLDAARRRLCRLYDPIEVAGLRFRLIDELHPDVTAPGVRIISARAKTGTIYLLGADADAEELGANAAYYTLSDGTSMATPHVAGVAALLLSADPGLTPAEVQRAIVETARPMPGYAPFEAGAGYVDAYAAVHRVAARRAIGLGLPYGRGYPHASVVPYAERMARAPYGFEPLGEPWRESGSYTTGVREYRLFSRPFPAGTTTVKLTSDYDPTLEDPLGLLATSNIWVYRPTDGATPPGDDRAVATWTGKGRVAFINDPVTDDGKPEVKSDLYWHNLRGAFSVLTGTGGVELPKSEYAFWVQPFRARFKDAAFEASLSGLSEQDRGLVARLVRAGALEGVGRFDPQAALTRAQLARTLALYRGLKQYLPEAPTYADVPATHPAFPYVEAVLGQWDFAGEAARDQRSAMFERLKPALVMGAARIDPATGAAIPDLKHPYDYPDDERQGLRFYPAAPVSRIDLVVALARLGYRPAAASPTYAEQAAALARTYDRNLDAVSIVTERSCAEAPARDALDRLYDALRGRQPSPARTVILEYRVKAQGLGPDLAGYLAVAYRHGWLAPVRRVTVAEPSGLEVLEWCSAGTGQQPRFVYELYFDPAQPMPALEAYRLIDRVRVLRPAEW